MTLPRVHLHEEVMREGMQIESVDISTDEKLELLDALSRTGLRWINVGSFVSPNYTPQMAHIDELLARFVPAPGVHYTALALNQKGRDRAAAYPFIESPPLPPTLIAHLCDTFVRRNANQRQRDEIDRWPFIADMALASKAATGGIGVNAAWGSNFEGKFSLDERMGMLERAHRVWDERGVPVRFLMLGDPMSWNTPGSVAETLHVALGHWPEIDSVYLHLHDARGMTVASIYAAIQECGERDLHLDTTVGGIGGCPYCGNGRATGMAATEDVVHLAESMGINTGIDLDALIEVIPLLERIIGRAVPGHVGHAGPRPTAERLYDENLPLAETFEEAQHFRVGKTVFGIPHRPWREPIPARRPAQKRRDVTKRAVPMSEDILVAGTEGNVRTLRLNRPGRANALSQELLTRLADELVAAESDPRIWAVVLTGTGTTFCAGADLKEMAALDSGQARHVRPKVSASTSVFELPLQMETPVIAALNGNAVAGGFELALACDIRIGAQGARFGFPEAKRGMGAAFGTVVLPRLIPQGIAMELLYTGRYIEADEAWRLGLLNRLVDPDEVLPTAMRLATEIAQNAPITVRRMKANVLAASGQPLLSALRLDSGPDPYSSEDRVEGVQAFLEKRQPKWGNR